MKSFVLTIATTFLFAGLALAQAPATTQPKPSQHQPGVAVPSSSSSAQSSPQDPKSADAGTKVDPAKEAAIRHLMDITETSKLGDNIASYLQGQVQDGVSHAIGQDKVGAFMGTFNEKFSATSAPRAVTDAMVPIYAKAFSMEDIQGLIQFYESPLGKRVVKALPDVVQESQKAGVQIEQADALKVLREMTDQYPELKQALPPDGGSPEPRNSPAPGAAPAPNPAPSPSPNAPSK